LAAAKGVLVVAAVAAPRVVGTVVVARGMGPSSFVRVRNTKEREEIGMVLGTKCRYLK
tara:strand:+ start:3009 stop:3182 length:174 start_codon:yes stop_codon:yes gene_type:complete